MRNIAIHEYFSWIWKSPLPKIEAADRCVVEVIAPLFEQPPTVRAPQIPISLNFADANVHSSAAKTAAWPGAVDDVGQLADAGYELPSSGQRNGSSPPTRSSNLPFPSLRPECQVARSEGRYRRSRADGRRLDSPSSPSTRDKTSMASLNAYLDRNPIIRASCKTALAQFGYGGRREVAGHCVTKAGSSSTQGTCK